MDIPIKVKSNTSGRVKEGSLTPVEILECCDEAEVIQVITDCDCEPVGETNFIECRCDDEWEDCDLWIDGKTVS